MTITPTYQTITGVGDEVNAPGNCLVASVATITSFRLEDIPHFVNDYMHLAGRTVDSMEPGDWLEVLVNVQEWLARRGWDTEEMVVSTDMSLFGASPTMHLAMVDSNLSEGFVPHIIVTDARGMQVWDPNPLSTAPYQPGDVLALMQVTIQ